jgi:hypothetical protein
VHLRCAETRVRLAIQRESCHFSKAGNIPCRTDFFGFKGEDEMTRAFLVVAAVLALGSPAYANTVINFETQADGVTPFVAMSNSPGAPVPLASQLSTQFLSSNGVTFGSGAGYVAVVDHVPSCGSTCTPTPPNIIGGTAADGTLNYTVPITASFFSTADTSVKATTGFVRVLGDKFPDGSIATLEAYGEGGNLLGSISVPEGTIFGQGADLSLTLAGIQSVRFFSNGGTVGFDNFEFGDLQAAVPEPASWAMMIIGFAAAGAGVRRRGRLAIA